MVNESMASMAFKTEFAVDMTCESCVNDVKRALQNVQGIDSCDVDLSTKQVVVTGRAPPSVVSKALRGTGRQVLVRGAGNASGTHDGAAVAILETPLAALHNEPSGYTQQVHGIARMVQVSTSPLLMLLDLTIRFPGYPLPASAEQEPPREYDVYVSTTGDVSDPPRTTGKPRLSLTRVTPDVETGYADSFLEVPVGVWDIVGRAMVVEPVGGVQQGNVSPTTQEGLKGFRKGRLGILAGVIARSAGAWGNEKTVCACSGQTMWEEGRMIESKSKI